MKLNIGCGTKKLDGWINIDCVPEFNPDLLHDICHPLPYSDLSIDEILAEDILEHFNKYERFIVFYDWARVLKEGGIVTLSVPNMHKILSRYFHFRLKFNYDSFFNRIFGEPLRNSKTYIGHFGIHKWGYTEKTLKEFIENFGLKAVKVIKNESNLIMVAKKYKHISKDKMEKIIIYLTGKETGPSIVVKDVEKYIEDFKASATETNPC
jgi:hypothetical protein